MSSIRRHLANRLVLGFGLLWCVGILIVYYSCSAVLQSEFDTGLLWRANAIISAIEQKGDRLILEDGNQLDPLQPNRHSRYYFQLWLADDRVAMRSRQLGTNDLPHSTTRLEKAHFRDLPLPTGKAGRAVELQFTPRIEGDKHPTATTLALQPVRLVTVTSRDSLDRTLHSLLATLAGTVVLMLIAIWFLVIRLVHTGLTPVKQIADHAARLDIQSLSHRFPVDSLPEELRPICQRLNDLMARLETSFERERRFSADVAHELRTPIAELRSLTEVALKWPEDPAATPQTLQSALEIACQMERLVNSLLAMVRCESGTESLQLETVSLGDLIKETWGPFAKACSDKQLAVAIRIDAACLWRTDRAMLGSILTNLFSNAVEYTPAGGDIQLELKPTPAGFEFDLSNSPVTLTASDLTYLFDRFWRQDAARSGSQHCGLGLALARSLARVLQLQLDARLHRPSTITFRLKPIEASVVPPPHE